MKTNKGMQVNKAPARGLLARFLSFLRLNEWQGIGGVVGVASLVVAIIALRSSSTPGPVPHAPSIEPDLNVSFIVEQFTGANVLIGNQGKSIINVKDLTINWKYGKCPRFREPSIGAPMVSYRYNVNLSTADGSKVIDTKEFKYSEGEVDKFLIDLNYPDYGIYTVWLTFKYIRLGENSQKTYSSEQSIREVCEKY